MHPRKDRGLRRGMNMVELLGVMAVLGVLIGIVVGGVTSGQESARVTCAQQELSAYRGAFAQATVLRPGLLTKRLDTWGAGGAAYTSEAAFQELVALMNEALEEKLTLVWDSSRNCYRSRGEDPWGSYYILTEYPQLLTPSDGRTAENRFTPDPNTPEMACAIWATGSSGEILEDGTIGEDSYGVGLVYSSGICVEVYSGFDDKADIQRYEGYKIPLLTFG